MRPDFQRPQLLLHAPVPFAVDRPLVAQYLPGVHNTVAELPATQNVVAVQLFCVAVDEPAMQ